MKRAKILIVICLLLGSVLQAANEIQFVWLSGKTLTYGAYQPDGTVRTAAGTSLPEISTNGYYTVDDGNVLVGDSIVIKESTNVIGGGVYEIPTDSTAVVADAVWDEDLTGATHNITASSGRRLRELADVVVYSGTAQGPGTGTNQIQLDTGAANFDGAYDPSLIAIVEGAGAGQSRLILEYAGATFTATVDRDWKTLPNAASEFIIYASAGRDSVNEGLATAGSSLTITLNALASDADDAYKNQNMQIRSGTGADQVRRVSGYNGTTKVATVSTAWDVTPDSTSGYVMLPDACKEIQAINGTELTDQSGANWLTFFDNSDAVTLVNIDFIEFIKNYLEGDTFMDTTTTPWQEVIKLKGTATELARKDLTTPAGANITTEASIVGNITEP